LILDGEIAVYVTGISMNMLLYIAVSIKILMPA